MRLLVACLAMLAAAGASAQAIRPQERARLDRYERTAGTALMEALAAGDAADIAALTTAL
ncbi:MAG: hypothetical protein P8P70_01365 [Sulfitobacter sp.]|nr:hypothetical protein [Sulfitobacter sp.]